MLRGLTWLMLFQLCGSAVQALILPILPGPIIGLVLLFVFLLWRGEVDESIADAASGLLRYLPLLLVPVAVGVMVYAQALAADVWALCITLLLSLVLSLLFAGWLMQKLIDRQQRKEKS